MSVIDSLGQQVRPTALIVMSMVIAAATYSEFVYYGPSTLYSVALWIVVVPMLLASTVQRIRSHPLYRVLACGGFVAIGTFQYLDGEWFLFAGLFVLSGVVGLVVELRD